jgi:hypothetical protein
MGSLATLPVLCLFRRVLGNTLLGRNADLNYKYEPLLTIIPKVLIEHDLSMFLCQEWNKKLKQMPRKDKVFCD